MTDVRVRFSPAPTGSLHIGGARTALFNWLFARHVGGAFVLRIEDTDVARSRDEWVRGIQDTMAWLGLDWDEGPVLQSSRFDRYAAAAEQLLGTGRAYRCFCTEEEVRARTETAIAAGKPPGYDGHCRDLDGGERARLEAAGRVGVVRFRTPDVGTSTFTDVVRGHVQVDWDTVHDFVIVRSDGTPIFFLANAVDDIEMGITHVIRGEDLLDSTHRVLAIRAALGVADAPTYAHLPLIVDVATRAKLSKRHGAVALEDFRDAGYLPEALLNYTALLGWAPPQGTDEILDASALVGLFELDAVTHAAAGFDRQKLDWVNGEWIRRLSVAELTARLAPLARARFDERLDERVLERAVAIAQERAVTLVQMLDQMDFLFVDESDFEVLPDSWAVLERTDAVAAVLDAVIAHVERCEWTVDALALKDVVEPLGVKFRKVAPAVYAAVEGVHRGLPLYDSMCLLGRERTLGRLRAARSRLG